MTEEEAMRWMEDLIRRLADERGGAGNACSFEAIKAPIRRKILHALLEKALDIAEISEIVGIKGRELGYHLNFLSSSYFIRVEGDRVDLTPGGISVIRADKRTQGVK
jgi:DNA-binding transcriptional ArsR family regulator